MKFNGHRFGIERGQTFDDKTLGTLARSPSRDPVNLIKNLSVSMTMALAFPYHRSYVYRLKCESQTDLPSFACFCSFLVRQAMQTASRHPCNTRPSTSICVASLSSLFVRLLASLHHCAPGRKGKNGSTTPGRERSAIPAFSRQRAR